MSANPLNVKAIFCEALDKATGQERAAYLSRVCVNRDDIRSQVEELLRLHDGAGRFLEQPPLDPELTLDSTAITEAPGTVIGRYKLLEKIGEGGMAVVYMAEQEQPIRRKVALKIIKLGMDTRQVIARFEAERQALALMDHPNIAKVLDAGATETGRPYFVMELVQGASITEYCDRNSLSTKDRLGLFIQVCNAVQHAHQKGIIHRDLKPSNVMVTHHDSKPVPKVIDFGIAKATNQRLTEKTLFTRYAHLIGTPAYMSPEQAELSDLDIDTRTDIYSLGVLLYELLTGTTPFSEEELRKAGYAEMQRMIREQQPVKPSTRIRTAYVAQPPSAGVTPEGGGATGVHRTPHQQVRGDLDWIVMKSLEKDRSRRYDTPNSLASDILRHLEHEPVLARGPSATYRVERFLRRHRMQMTAILAIVVVAVAVGVIVSMWNRDRLQLAEAEGFKHQGILSQAREQYAKAERDAALETIKPILDSKHVGPDARLLQATILVDNRRSDEAVAILDNLLNERPEVAGAAHSLLARILWESESPNAEKLKEIEEHRKQAETLLPETAEAYFLRAMTAVTIKEQLAALDRALQLDSGHYESRRLRAYTYYASRKYDQLKDDALVMTILRPRDPLGYSLRAVAWRELGRLEQALADYDVAIGLRSQGDPQHIDLSAQRCETLLRMGDYERVIAESQECSKFWPDKPIFQYHAFCALTALGEYDTATTLFREIIATGHEARLQFQDWCMKYVFDTLNAGRSWHSPDREPEGAAFLSLIEAEETYGSLTAKAHRMTTDGFSAAWSPDGKKLAFSLGVQGHSGVAVFDPMTRETDLLIVPGKDPRWSPDGEYIAFVRDRQNLRLEDLGGVERRNQERPVTDEEVWLMKSDGTEPRRLARGGWPSWRRDSLHIYYQSRTDDALCSISIQDRDAQPQQILTCPNSFPSVSHDNQRVAFFDGDSLKAMDMSSQTTVVECVIPSFRWGSVSWSPTDNEVCLCGNNLPRDKIGLWMWNLDGRTLTRLLDGQIQSAAWSPKAMDLTFCLGLPYAEIWNVKLDPNVSVANVLGPVQTVEDHCREMIALYTRRIDMEPSDANNYPHRAQWYHRLHEEAKADADMELYSRLTARRKSSHGTLALPSGTWWSIERAISGPFQYRLVFSGKVRRNGTHVLRVALGQKGRCEMRLFEVPVVVMSLLGFGMLSGPQVAQVRDYTFSTPANLGPNVNSTSDEWDPCISMGGLELYFNSHRTGGYGQSDLWVSRRTSTGDDWGTPVNLGPSVNSPYTESGPSISSNRLELYFSSERPGGSGGYDLWLARRATTDEDWGIPENLGPVVNSVARDENPCISADGLELFFESRRSGSNNYDLWMSSRESVLSEWGAPVNLGPLVNGLYITIGSSISSDGRWLVFSALRDEQAGLYDFDIWATQRANRSATWAKPVNLGLALNTAYKDVSAHVSADGLGLFFVSDRPGGLGGTDIWQAQIVPIVDFNADGTVDLVDLTLLIENWGMADIVYDIGPMPWGDGKVDIEDLKVFIAEWERENPPSAMTP